MYSTVYPLYCGHSHILLIVHGVVCDPKLAFLEVQEGREEYGLSFEELHPGQNCWEVSKAPPSPLSHSVLGVCLYSYAYNC